MDIDDLFPPPQRLTPERQERIRSILLDELPPATAPHRSRRGNRRWWMLAAPVAAAAAVTAIAIAATVLVPAGHPGGGSPARHAAAPPPITTSRQVLLAAAAKVAQQHPGRYWYTLYNFRFSYDHGLKMSGHGTNPIDLWFAHDQTAWDGVVCQQGPTGTVVLDTSEKRLGRNLGPLFVLGNALLTYDVVQHWPTSATGLKARIATYTHNKDTELNALVALETTVPAPPGVRAAAYRAIAALPGLQYRGTVKGGHAVYIPARDGASLLLVIDPATGLIDGETYSIGGGQTGFQTFVTTQWANHLPKVVPLSQDRCPPGH
jgi:hypothetical protein